MRTEKTKEIVFQVEGTTVRVIFGHHTLNERCIERNITPYSIASLVMALGEELLDMKMSEAKEFGILDMVMEEGAICSLSWLDDEIYVDVITVVATKNLYVKNGARVLKLHEAVSI